MPAQFYDWTRSEFGRSNSSGLFLRMEKEMSRIIKNSAFDLINGRAEDVGGLIMAQLAHQWKFVPTAQTPGSGEENDKIK